MPKICSDHMAVTKTMFESQMINRHEMQTIRGQILKIDSFKEREEFLKKMIKKLGDRDKKRKELLSI